MKNLSITKKLLISITALIWASIFFVTYLFYNNYTKDLKVQSAYKNQQIIDLVSINIGTYLDDLFRLSLSPYYNDAVMDALDLKISGNDMKYLERLRTVENFLDEMMIIPRNDILRVMIFTDEIFKSERIPTNIDYKADFKKFDWYNQALKEQKPVFVPAHLEEIVKNPKNIIFSVVNQIRSTRNTDRILGVIKVDANYSGIESICNNISMGKDGGMYIIDDSGTIIFKNIYDIPYQDFYKKINTKNTYITATYKNKKYLLNSAKISRSNWHIISVSSLDQINKKAIETRNKAFLMSLICSIFAFIILAVFLKLLLKPLLGTIKHIKEVQNGDLSVVFPVEQKDEIGYLNSSLNIMISKINQMMLQNTDLVKEVYEAKYLHKEAQINILYNQIRPHFIYNTLNMISILVQTGRSQKAVDNINKLSNLLRGIANLDKEITVENEINLLHSYLVIQNSRYEGKLEYSIDIAESLYQCVIPALIFQPVVENSVIHVCEKRRETTIINIVSSEKNDTFTISISDNGDGISAPELDKIKQKLDDALVESSLVIDNNSKNSGIGLANANRRIKLKYGKEYGLTIESIINKGTIVKIFLPKVWR